MPIGGHLKNQNANKTAGSNECAHGFIESNKELYQNQGTLDWIRNALLRFMNLTTWFSFGDAFLGKIMAPLGCRTLWEEAGHCGWALKFYNLVPVSGLSLSNSTVHCDQPAFPRCNQVFCPTVVCMSFGMVEAHTQFFFYLGGTLSH